MLLRLLMRLSLLSLLDVQLTQAAAEGQMLSGSSELDISPCPITFYGQTYENLYVNFDSDKVVACFDGFYDPKTRGDCIMGPPFRDVSAVYLIHPFNPLFEEYVRHMPSIKTRLQCVVELRVTDGESAFIISLFNLGTQAALYVFNNIQASSVFHIQVDGVTVDTVDVTNAPGSYDGYKIMDISGCRHSGVLYKPGTAMSSGPEICFSLTCSEAAVLRTNDCGPHGVL